MVLWETKVHHKSFAIVIYFTVDVSLAGGLYSNIYHFLFVCVEFKDVCQLLYNYKSTNERKWIWGWCILLCLREHTCARTAGKATKNKLEHYSVAGHTFLHGTVQVFLHFRLYVLHTHTMCTIHIIQKYTA